MFFSLLNLGSGHFLWYIAPLRLHNILFPFNPSLHLSSFTLLLATLASFGSWWDVIVLSLSGRESPLRRSVYLWLPLPVWSSTHACVCEHVHWVCGPGWPAEVTDWDCTLTAGEEMIYLSGGWGTGRQIQLTDRGSLLPEEYSGKGWL